MLHNNSKKSEIKYKLKSQRLKKLQIITITYYNKIRNKQIK